MRALKVAVVLMGVAIVAGFTALFVLWSEKRAGSQGGVVAAVATASKAPVDAVVPIPPGTRVVRTSPDGPMVDVLVEHPDGTRDLLRVRRADGAVVATLRFRPARP